MLKQHLSSHEIWKPIKYFEGIYEVSNLGRVRNKKRDRIRKHKINTHGYLSIVLSISGKTKTTFIHRLIADAFIPNPNNLKEINHIDGNKLNNSIDNLEWCTRSYNVKHSFDIGLRSNKGKAYSINPNSHFKKAVVQKDLNRVFIREWKSVETASNELKIANSNIAACARGVIKTAGKFIWEYKNKEVA